MSFAASKLQLESPTAELADPFASTSVLNHEAEVEADALEKLLGLPSTTAGPVIAIDLDDVLSQTNQVVAECKSIKQCLSPPQTNLTTQGHNEIYGTQMEISHFYCKSTTRVYA